MGSNIQPSQQIGGVEKPVQFSQPQLQPLLVEVTTFLRLEQARTAFSVTGNGLTAAVLDTGLRVTHVDFAGRVKAQRNFTTDNGNNPDDASDGHGHGTNVCGIVAASNLHGGIHKGVAPDAGIVPLKVLPDDGPGSFLAVEQALDWVINHRTQYQISVVSMSFGDERNHTSDESFSDHRIREQIRQLKAARVPVIVAAGNQYFSHNSQQGMNYPAILRETISVGAVYDANIGEATHGSAIAFSTKAGQITPFSQRLHERVNPDTRTDIFAPGAPVTSSGRDTDEGQSVQNGTSQATPVITGIILLMQEYYLRQTNQMPPVDDLITWLRNGGVVITDGDDEDDNVANTGLNFIRVDALSALDAVRRHLQMRMLTEARALKA